MYGKDSELTKKIIGYDINSLYRYCAVDVMICDKHMLVVNEKPFDQKHIAIIFEECS